VYFNFPFPIYGLMIDVGSTPNKDSAVIAGGTDIRFIKYSDDTILDQIQMNGPRDWGELGFEQGMEIVVTNSTSNNVTEEIHSISGRSLFLKGNTLAASEEGKTAGGTTTVTYTGSVDLTASTDVFEAYNDEGGWTRLGTVQVDGTANLTKNGLILWDEKVVNFSAKPFNDSQYNSYWYRMSTNDYVTQSANIGISGLAYPIGDQNVGQIAAVADGMQSTFGLARTVASWKNRTTWTFDYLPYYVYISAQAGFNVLNGFDFGIVRVGDGRNNAILAQVPFYNELIVFQEEKGVKGGLVTVIEGNVPEEYGTLVLSDEVGIMNAKAFAMVDGVEVKRESIIGSTRERLKLVFFLSRHGIMTTDGQVIYQVSNKVRNYFDPQDDNSIRAGYEAEHYMWYNKDRKGIEIGLVTGDTATTPNTFLFYDLLDGEASEDTFAQGMSCGTVVEAASGDKVVLALRGGSDTGVVYRVNGLNDVSTAIDMDIVMEINGGGKRISMDQVVTRLKRQSSGVLTLSHAINGSTLFSSGDATRAMDMSTGLATDTYQRYDLSIENPKGDLISLRWRNNGDGVEAFVADVGLSISEVDAHSAIGD
ncbi:MAG: hypothetical protein KAJ19_16860, partial [Gammaproteobacteria bacterium]|nr:hypothetical protein [Gammaproteobacteria bacterium]